MTTELYSGVDTDAGNRTVTIRQWAETYLNASEFEEYLQAEARNNELMNHYESSGLFTRETITEEVFVPSLNKKLTVQAGVKTILAPGITVLDIPIDPEFGAWHARYAADPNINYNPTIQL